MSDGFDLGAPLGVSEPLILMAALLIDWVIGDLRWLFRFAPHPVALIGGLIAALDRRLNRAGRSDANRVVRGALVTVFVAGVAATAGWGLHWLCQQHAKGWLVEALFVAILLAQRSLAGRVGDVGKSLAKGDLADARAGLRHLVGRDPDRLDKHAVARASVESLSENFSDAVAAPAFWYLLLGLPGLCAYKAINTLDSMIGYRSEQYRSFGMAAARLDDAVNWIPARLSGLLIILAALFAPSANPAGGFKTMLRDARKHPSPNAGWPEAAMAGALGLALGGPRSYPGGQSEATWIGDGRARLEAADIRRAVLVFTIACGLLWLCAAPLALLSLNG
ncbi:MAG: adenosylcobinamide-phosphate synthase CbiB [Alphaproteobacteria bacterium]|nr:adenosylcobinamide-phosphate synthase CbiB [Alphaproteobacteria bacterium]